ncbi:DUF2339 domain-containing protein [Mycobacterium sp. Z3061]|uniref:DUF2339 domain-containing protein n=1 Tax=Mycobacterium sp. Z3061 TaxID=3073562 RepID=UPI002873D161|nr:DUF2339 domain-containing protein [Mycobacterium sp. Z3061]
MTESHQAVISRLSHEFDALARQMSRVSGELTQLDRLLATTEARPTPAPRPAPVFVPPPPVAPQPQTPQQQAASYWQNYWQYWQPAAVAPAVPRPQPRSTPRPDATPPPQHPETVSEKGESSWIGKLLAVAGVAVTLIGVVLLLVLAAQAGLLRPEIRVAGGMALAGALVGAAIRLRGRPGGRTGAIALAATGIATAYLDVIAVVTIYSWVVAPVGLVLAAVVGGAGLALARRWDSEHLALLVLVPLIVLAPEITHGVDLLLISFMLALSAAALPVQLGKDWTWMHAARIAAATLPLLVALPAAGPHDNAWLLGGACAVAAILAIATGLVLLPATKNPGTLALLTSVGTAPILASAISVDRVLAAVLTAALAVGILAAALIGRHPRIVTQIWLVWSAISALVALSVACTGYVEGPVLLALAIVTAIVGRRDTVARWIALGFGVIGCGLFYSYAPLQALLRATAIPTSVAVSTLAASLLVIAFAVVMTRAWLESEAAGLLVASAAALVVYAVTAFTVTAGVVIGGTGGGFLAGHMAATICWIAMAAGLFVHALRSERERRTESITAGLALTAAATGKLFLFDLATLDGIFRVAAFIIVGLVLLSMGAGYARSLAR